jgi:hypothetical protein
MRRRYKSWQNGTYQNWTARIIWYQGPDVAHIRLAMEDCERKLHVYPANREAADNLYQMFRQGAPHQGIRVPFVADLLRLAGGRIALR